MTTGVVVFFSLLGFATNAAADGRVTPVQTVSISTKTVGYPQLIWEKHVDSPLVSTAISNDGRKVFISVSSGILVAYDTTGIQLWKYRYPGKLPERSSELRNGNLNFVFRGITPSNMGKHVFVELNLLYDWIDEYGTARTEYEPQKIMCLDGETGQVLWEEKGAGEVSIWGTKYVLVEIATPTEDGSEMTAIYRDSVFDTNGKRLFSVVSENAGWAHGFSDDGKYVYFNRNLVDVNTGKTVWALEDIGDFISVRDKWALVANRKSISIYDIASKKEIFSPPKTGELFWAFLGNMYFLTLGKAENKYPPDFLEPALDVLNVYDYRTKQLLWSSKGKWPVSNGKHGILNLTEDGEHIVLGNEEGLAFLDVTGKTIWTLSMRQSAVKWPLHFKYSSSGNGEFILRGYGQDVSLYRAF